MTDSNIDLSDIFSRLLIHFKKFDKFSDVNPRLNLTTNGHGPFCTFGNGSSAFDLRRNCWRWAYGHSHPLLLKSTLDALKHSLPNTQNELLELQEIRSNIAIEKGYKYYSLLNELHLGLEDVKSQLKLSAERIYFITEADIAKPDKLKQLKIKIDSHNGKCIVIEKDLVNYHNSGSLILHTLKTIPQVFITNWGLPSYLIYLQSKINFTNNSASNLTNNLITENFLKLLRESNILGDAGLIATRERRLSKAIDELKLNCTLLGTCLMIQKCKDTRNTLLGKGLVCDYENDNLILNFPISLKEDQLDLIIKILKEQIRCIS